jgi:hypothetical protein
MSGKAQDGAQVRIPLQAELTFTARDGRVNRDSLAMPLAAFDNSGELVSKDEWLLELHVPDARSGEPVQVRATQADSGDAEENLAGTGHWLGLVVQAQISNGVQTKNPRIRI